MSLLSSNLLALTFCQQAVFSPDASKIALLEVTGRVAVFSAVPLYRPVRYLSPEDLSSLVVGPPPASDSPQVITHGALIRFLNRPIADKFVSLIKIMTCIIILVEDIGWWSNDLLILAFFTGEVVVVHLTRLANLLGMSQCRQM